MIHRIETSADREPVSRIGRPPIVRDCCYEILCRLGRARAARIAEEAGWPTMRATKALQGLAVLGKARIVESRADAGRYFVWEAA